MRDKFCIKPVKNQQVYGVTTVEKATVLARSMESDSVMHNKTIKTAFAHIFCLLIRSLEDINAAVSQRTIQYLETIKSSSIKVGFFSNIYKC